MRLEKCALSVRFIFDVQLSNGARPCRNFLEVHTNLFFNAPGLVVCFDEAIAGILDWLSIAIVIRYAERVLQVMANYVVCIEERISLADHDICLIEANQLNLLHNTVEDNHDSEHHSQAAALL